MGKCWWCFKSSLTAVFRINEQKVSVILARAPGEAGVIVWARVGRDETVWSFIKHLALLGAGIEI